MTWDKQNGRNQPYPTLVIGTMMSFSYREIFPTPTLNSRCGTPSAASSSPTRALGRGWSPKETTRSKSFPSFTLKVSKLTTLDGKCPTKKASPRRTCTIRSTWLGPTSSCLDPTRTLIPNRISTSGFRLTWQAWIERKPLGFLH